MWQIILPVAIVYLLTLLIGSFWTFDKLVRLEYKDHRPMWEKDGMPHGSFWIAPENRKRFGVDLRGQWAYGRLNLVWLFSTPGWMREDGQALRLVRRFRILVILWNASLILPILVLLVVFK